VRLRDRIHDCFRLAADEPDGEKRRRLLTFYVAGAGFTGVEMIGELAEYVPILCKRFHIRREDVKLVDVDGLPRPVPVLPEKLSGRVERRLTKMGVEVVMNASVVGVGENFIRLKQKDTVSEHAAGTVIWTAGIESAEITADAAKEVRSAGRGRIEVDSYLRSVDHENVFVIGDNMFYTVPGEERPVPQMVENAEHSAGTAANNIAVSVTKKGSMQEYSPKFHGIMVCVGGRSQAVANATEMGAQAGDKLGVGVVTSIADSTDAAADAEGVAQAYTTVSALTVNADGVITSAQIDAVQANVKFDATGKITTDLTAAVDSQNVIGAGYGMKAASSIGKEWNEQAAAYAQYAIGKTADEVNGTAGTEGVPSDADLAASVTIHVTDFNSVITKAADSAK